ncbi:MAG: heme lyase CcmF/NrfE family subunit, partial [Pseudomonadales bacterium]
FDRNLPLSPADGSDLNPLLQDFGLIVHPPILYMGYVGFGVPFAFALATLTTGRVDAAWARWSRPWTNIAWAFLTLGITLGSWWAYYELGWGGWWFWDPVENASFMPWLVGTALIHSLAATEKRGVFKSWTLLLALTAFSLSLLGAFLVRSGVLTSVHAFAVDPARGLFILVFLVLVIGGSLLLYALKAAGIRSESGFGWTSREAMLLTNNLLLVVATAAVLLGTLYPLLFEVMTGGDKISVGPPYFNAVFVPVAALLFAVMALGPWSRWKKTPVVRLVYQRAWSGLAALALMSVVAFMMSDAFVFDFSAGMSVSSWLFGFLVQTIAVWLLLGLCANWWQVAGRSWPGLFKQSRAWYGMFLGHLGIGVAILGVSLTSHYSQGKDVRMLAGDVTRLGGYDFRLQGLSRVRGPNYVADQAEVIVLQDGREVTRLYPEKRFYQVAGNVMTEAALDPGLFRDLYVALGEPVADGAWAVRLQVKPFVRWIWLGGLLIAAGGIVSVLDRRYRSSRARLAAGEALQPV